MTEETILVVDDDDSILKLVVGILSRANFNVLQAHSGAHAVELASAYEGKIDLLLSDVRMPGMTGPELGAVIKHTLPDIRVMFMSGFPDGDVLILNYGWAYITKPFVPTKLVEMVTNVLHSPNKSQSTHRYDTGKDTDPNKKIEEGQTPPPKSK